MSEERMIEIDFDVHKRIEMERTSFQETPNDVLRRLLKIGDKRATKTSGSNAGRAWSGKGATLPQGTELRMDYNGRVHTGVIENGVWLIEGQRFMSPSAAASGVALTKSGEHTSLDGWIYWNVKRPGDTAWIALKSLRGRGASLNGESAGLPA